MKYYLNKTIKGNFEEISEKVIQELSKEGFGIVTQFDVDKAFKEKLGITFRKYRILGACNPSFAKKAIEANDKIGTLLPCNVMLQHIENGVEVAIINPVIMMNGTENNNLKNIADEILVKMQRVLNNI